METVDELTIYNISTCLKICLQLKEILVGQLIWSKEKFREHLRQSYH